jgi:hypothetical protein
MKRLWAGTAVFLILAAAGCASHAPDEAGPAPLSQADSARDANGLQVQVDNQNINDMSIYLLRSGSRFLVGQAGGLSKTTLTIPEGMTSRDLRVRLIAQPIGGAIVGIWVLVRGEGPPGREILWACLAAMFVAGPAQAQNTATPLTKTVAVTGKAANGKAFKGKFAISNFKSVGGKTYAVGTLTGADAIRRMYENGLAPGAMKPNPKRLVVDGENVAVEIDLIANGNAVALADFFTVRDGKIARLAIYSLTPTDGRLFDKVGVDPDAA